MPVNIDRVRAIMTRASTGREVTLIYATETKTGLKGGITEQNSWQIQGFIEDYKFSVYVHANAFTSELEAQKTIYVDDKSMRILAVNPDSVGALIRLDLGGLYGR